MADLKPCGKRLSLLSCFHRAGDDCGKFHTFCLEEIAELLAKNKNIAEKQNYGYCKNIFGNNRKKQG